MLDNVRCETEPQVTAENGEGGLRGNRKSARPGGKRSKIGVGIGVKNMVTLPWVVQGLGSFGVSDLVECDTGVCLNLLKRCGVAS